MSKTLKDSSELEKKKFQICKDKLISPKELFNQIDVKNNGTICLDDQTNYGEKNNILLTKDDWRCIMERFIKKDRHSMSYDDFCKIWVPFQMNEIKKVIHKTPKERTRLADYSPETQRGIKDIIYSTVKTQENFETNRTKAFRNQDRKLAQEIFEKLDNNKDGLIDFREFSKGFLNGDKSGRFEDLSLNCLFEQFDSDKDGLIGFEEFFKKPKHNPNYEKNSVYRTQL